LPQHRPTDIGQPPKAGLFAALGEGTDRTTKRTNEIRRLELNRNRMAAYRARKRTRDALPKRITEALNRGKSLVKRAR